MKKSMRKKVTILDKEKIYILPIIFVLAVIPLIVKAYVSETHLEKFNWFPYMEEHVDVFFYYKQVYIVLIGMCMLGILAYNFYKKKTIKSIKIYIPLLVYGVCSIISTIFSENHYFSLNGNYSHFESIFVISSYLIICFYSYMLINDELDLEYCMRYFKIGIFLIAILGVLQYIGYDFFKTDIGKNLISSKYVSGSGFSFSDKREKIYSSLYNPNYVGVYVAMILPIVLFSIFGIKKIIEKIQYIILLLLLLICLKGSESEAGAIGVVSIIILFSIILLYNIYYRMKKNIFIRIVAYTLPLIILFLAGNFVIKHYSFSTFFSKENKHNLQEIQTYEDRVSITYKNEILDIIILIENNTFNKFLLLDENGVGVESTIKEDNLTYVITDLRFSEIELVPLTYEDIIGFQVTIDKQQWFFTNQLEDRSYYYVNQYGKYDKIVNYNDLLPRGFNSFATGRGYIWNRTLPILIEHILIGSGPDTFIMKFPHNDYVGAYNYGFLGQIMTKPHSLYLQIGVQTGVVSLLAFIVFYLVYFIQSIITYIKCKFINYKEKIGLGIFLGSFSYMITGIVNDSVVAVAPVFWCLIGIGFAINHIIKKDNK